MNRLFQFLVLFGLVSISCSASVNQIEGSKLYDSPTYSNLKISPNGQYISAVFRDDKRHTLSLIDVDTNSFHLELDLGLDSRLQNYHWLNDSQLFLIGKYESLTAVIIGTILEDKIDIKLSKAKGYLVDLLPEQPNNILFARKNRREKNDLYVVGINNLIDDSFDDAIEIEHDDSSVSYYFHDEVSDSIITSNYDSKSKVLTYKAIPKTGGDWRTILEKEIDDTEFRVVALLDSKYLAVLTNQQTDKIALQKYNIESQQLEEVIYQHSKYDLKAARYTKTGELAFVEYEEQGLMRAEYFNPVSEQINRRLSSTFKGLEYFLVDVDHSLNKAILKVRGADQPGEYLVYDNSKNNLTRLLLSHPELDGRALYKSKVFTIKSTDGADIEAFLTAPKASDSLSTLLVMPHGGPIGVKDDDRYNPLVQYYVSRGFSVLRVNFRGSEGYGKGFKEQGVGEFGKLIEEDITTVVNNVISETPFKHVCSIGSSYGGYSAVMLAIKHPNLYECVIGGFGVYDLPLLFNHDNRISQEKNRTKIEKVVGKYSIALKDFSPVYFAEKLKAPILLTAGVEDEQAVFEHTRRLAYVLEKIQHPVETMYYEHAGHGHSSWYGRRHEAAITYDFLLRTLGLSYPTSANLTDDARLALAEDFSIIADKYTAEDGVKNDEEKAFHFYKKAAEYGHSRANFNVGVYYHSGDQVDKDVEQAVKFYERAADLEYASAHTRLGRMYMEGEHFDVDWNKAKEYLEKGLNLDDTPNNYFRLARFDCTAPGTHRNIRRCLNIMQLERFSNRSKSSYKKAIKALRGVAPWILAETKFTVTERKEFEEILNAAFKINEMDATLESLRVGSFSYEEGIGYGKKDVYHDLSTGSLLENSKDDNHYFGIIFDVDVPGFDSRFDSVGIAARWTRNMKNGTKKYPSATVLYGTPKGEWRLLRDFSEFEDAESVTLEVFDLRGNPLLTKNFKLNQGS